MGHPQLLTPAPAGQASETSSFESQQQTRRPERPKHLCAQGLTSGTQRGATSCGGLLPAVRAWGGQPVGTRPGLLQPPRDGDWRHHLPALLSLFPCPAPSRGAIFSFSFFLSLLFSFVFLGRCYGCALPLPRSRAPASPNTAAWTRVWRPSCCGFYQDTAPWPGSAGQ